MAEDRYTVRTKSGHQKRVTRAEGVALVARKAARWSPSLVKQLEARAARAESGDGLDDPAAGA